MTERRPVTVRFAPSPTGRLHIGNIRTAVLNRLFAKPRGGRFILRLDDTDEERSREEYARAIIDDLNWLGLAPDAMHRQSERLARYDAAAQKLKDAGLLYPCYETERELALKRKAQVMAGRPPVYDRAALKLGEAEKAALERAGRKPHWRFRLPSGVVRFTDRVRGEVAIDLSTLSDPVLIRADGSYLYTLPSVVDDIEMEITHVIRGEDHVTNTAVQIALAEALGATPPAFAHHALMVNADGGPLSKRAGSLTVAAFREAGLEPETVVSYCATVGTSQPVAAFGDMDELAARFDLENLSRAPARFDERELHALNAKLLHAMDWETAAPRLRALGVDADEALWLAVRGNVEKLADVSAWVEVVHGHITPRIDPQDRDFIAAAARLLPREPWGGHTWKEWTAALKERTGRKGRALFQPLRRALTGRAHGPEMGRLLPLIGRARALERLSLE